jgi:transcriptional regulator with XRE-family HTH domain
MMTEKSREIISKNLKKARSAKGWTQVELAKKADINSNYYAKIERGDINPSYETFEKIFRALGVKSKDIFPV